MENKQLIDFLYFDRESEIRTIQDIIHITSLSAERSSTIKLPSDNKIKQTSEAIFSGILRINNKALELLQKEGPVTEDTIVYVMGSREITRGIVNGMKKGIEEGLDGKKSIFDIFKK